MGRGNDGWKELILIFDIKKGIALLYPFLVKFCFYSLCFLQDLVNQSS